MKNKLLLFIGVIVVALIITRSSAYIVQETEQVVITEFGKPVGDAITEPGIYFKVPFVQKAIFFEKRYMEWDGDRAQLSTKEKQPIFVDTYARWQITDPLQFYKRLTNERGAQTRIDDILDGKTKDFIAKNTIRDLVRSSNRTPMQSEFVDDELKDSLVPIEFGREIGRAHV